MLLRIARVSVVVPVAIAALIVGCAAPVHVIDDEADLNRSAEGRDVTVVFRDQSAVVVRDFHLEGDSASWKGRRVGRTDIVSVFFKENAVSRAMTGFLGGFCIGALVGGVIGHQSMSGEDKGLGETIGLALGGGAAGVIGMSVGMATTPVVQYSVPPEPPPRE